MRNLQSFLATGLRLATRPELIPGDRRQRNDRRVGPFIAVVAVLSSSMFALACTEDDDLAGPAGVVSPREAGVQTLRTPDVVFVELADRIPGGFGGMFIEDGRHQVWLKDTNQAGDAARALESLTAGSRRPIRASEVDVREGTFDWRELMSLRAATRDVIWAHDAVVTLDVNEGRNRIVVGLTDMSAADGLASTISALGVPSEAVIFEPRDPPVLFGTLQDHKRPVIGGYQVRVGFGPDCTNGVGVEFTPTGGGTAPGFITAAHCTTSPGFLHPDSAYQETVSPSKKVGLEERDPVRFQGGDCPSGWYCRWTDAALIRYDQASLMQRGIIERTQLNSITVVSDTTQRWKVIDDDNGCTGSGCSIIMGDPVEKVGRTTGWTSGEVVETCVCVEVRGPADWPSNTILLCQDWVGEGSATPIADGGDSGAVVFDRSGCCNATLYGILVGGDSANATKYFYSRIHLVKYELGGFDATAEPVLE